MFFIAGFAVAAWAPLVPYAKARADLNDGLLGLLLLCFGVGAMLTMPLVGALAARFGCRRVIVAATILLILTLPCLATLASPILLAVALFGFGAAIGAIDVTMNIQAIIVERAAGRAMMSGFHALFSLGGIAGAAGFTALLVSGITPLAATLCVVGGIALALVASVAHLLPYGSARGGPVFALPHGVVLLIGALCFIMFLTEGAVLDWSALFLSATREVDKAYAGLGYAAFALAMTLGRLTGDRIVQRFGGPAILLGGGICAATGFAIATLVPAWPVALVGYALVGTGCANIVPVLFTSAGRQTVMPEHLAVPAITTFGYAGVLAGPAAIGFVAQATSLTAAFLIVALLLLGVAASGHRLRAAIGL